MHYVLQYSPTRLVLVHFLWFMKQIQDLWFTVTITTLLLRLHPWSWVVTDYIPCIIYIT